MESSQKTVVAASTKTVVAVSTKTGVAVSTQKPKRHTDEFFSKDLGCWVMRPTKKNKKPKKQASKQVKQQPAVQKTRPIPAPRHSLRRFDFGPDWVDVLEDIPVFPKAKAKSVHFADLSPIKDNVGVTFGDNNVTRLINKLNKQACGKRDESANAQSLAIWLPPKQVAKQVVDEETGEVFYLDDSFQPFDDVVKVPLVEGKQYYSRKFDFYTAKLVNTVDPAKTSIVSPAPEKEMCYFHFKREIFSACPSCSVFLCKWCCDNTTLNHSGGFHLLDGQTTEQAAFEFQKRFDGLVGGGLSLLDMRLARVAYYEQKQKKQQDSFEREYLACHLPYYTEKKIESDVKLKVVKPWVPSLQNRFETLPVDGSFSIGCGDRVLTRSAYWEPEFLQKFPSQQISLDDEEEDEIKYNYGRGDYQTGTAYYTKNGRYYKTDVFSRCPPAHLGKMLDLYHANPDMQTRWSPYLEYQDAQSDLDNLEWEREGYYGLTPYQRRMRTWGKNLRRRQQRAVKRSENAMIQYYIDSNELFWGGVEINRELDIARGTVFEPKCQMSGCERPIVDDWCYKCIRHCRCPRCIHRALRLVKKLTTRRNKTRTNRRTMMKNFLRRTMVRNAQSLFGIDHNIKLGFLDKFAEHLAELAKDKVFWTRILSSVGVQIMQIIHNPDKTTVGLAITQIILLLPFTTEIASSLIVSVTDLFKWATKSTNAQSNEETSDLEGVAKVVYAVIMAIGLLIPALVIAKLPNSSDITSFINRFSKIGSCIRSFETLKDVVTPSLEAMNNYVRTKLLGLEPNTLDAWSDINAWCDRVAALHTTNFEKEIVKNNKLKEHVESLLIEGDRIHKLLDSLRIPQTQRGRVSTLMLFLHKARAMVAHSGSGYTEARVAPLVIHLTGDTGVGKSSVLPMLCARLLVHMGCTDPKDLYEKVYYRDPTSDFWDGFNDGARICIVDDIGQVKDMAGIKNNEPLEAIRMVNTAYFAPNMAHLENKGTTVFKCNVVIWTSNMPVVYFPSLTFPAAIASRIDLKFLQKPHPDFMVERNLNGEKHIGLNHAKVAELAETDQFAYEKAIVFQRMTPSQVKPIDPATMTFKEMSDLVIESYDFKMNNGDKFNAFQRSYFQHLVESQAQCSKKGSVIHTHWEPYFIQRHFGARVHLDIYNSLPHYPPQEYSGGMVNVEKKGSSLRKAVCVAVGTKYADRFMRAFSTAAYVAECKGKTEDEKDIIFDNVFFNFAAIGPNLYSICEEHGRVEYGFLKRWSDAILRSYAKVKENVARTDEYFEKAFEEEIGEPGSYNNYVRIFCWVTAFIGQVTPFIVMGLTSYAIFDWIRNLYRRMVGSENAEVYSAGANKGRQPQRNRERNDETYNSGAVKARQNKNVENAQAVLDQNASEVASTVVNNLYCIQFSYDKSFWHTVQTGTMVKGRILLTNKHLLNVLKEDELTAQFWRITNHAGSYSFDPKTIKTVYCDESSGYGERDVCLMEMSRNVPQHRDILKFFVSKDDFAYFKSVEWVSLLGYSPNQTNLILRQYFSNVCEAVDTVSFRLVDDHETRHVRSYFQYGIQTRRGDCGALMVIYDKARHRKIAGIHMAGIQYGTFQGVAQALHCELIEVLLNKLSKIGVADSFISCEPSVESGLVIKNVPIDDESSRIDIQQNVHGNFHCYGKAKESVHKNVKSRIYPSPIHGVVAVPTMKPAYLRPFTRNDVYYDPLEIARKKASTESVKVDEGILDASTEHLKCKVTKNRRDDDTKLLSHETAITGIDGDEFIQGICRKTSPGYGWVKSGKGKHAYLSNKDGSWRTDHPEVVAACENIRQVCRNGGRPCTFWTDTLKDEKRPIDKVNQGKTRLFSAGEMAYSIVFRQYFLPFIAHMMRNRIEFESTVGINVYSFEWTMLAARLTEVGPYVIAGDFSNYDGTLCAELLWKCLEIIEAFYHDSTEEERQIRRGLWSEIVHSIHIDGDNIYGWSHSQPSGCPMTTILNCLYHSISIRYVYILCAKKYKPDMISLNEYDRNVRHINYGDDDVTNISKEIIDWFNQETITDAYLELGMVYTDEAKTGEIVKYRYLKDVAFLKRKFRWDDDTARYWAPLSLETIREMAMWVHGTVDVAELTATTLQDAVHELAMHSKEVFDRELPAFQMAARQLTKPVNIYPYKFYQFIETNRWGLGNSESSVINQLDQIIDRRQNSAETAAIFSPREGYLPQSANVCPRKNKKLSARSISRQLKSAAKMKTGLAQSNNESTEQMQGQLDFNPAVQSDTQQILTFHEEGPVGEGGLTPMSIPSYYKAAEDDLANDVIGILGRPILAKHFTWATNTGIITSLATVNLPKDWINTTMIAEKLAGFRYLRCDFVVRLQVNAQQFNAGRLMLVFNPFEQQLRDPPSNFIHFGGLTGYPHVDLDLAEDTSVELRIPFTGPASHYDLITAANCLLGTVHTIIYSPLTGGEDVDCTMWVYAENVSPQMPTGLPISPQLYTPTGVAQANGPKSKVRKTKARDSDEQPQFEEVEKTTRPGTVETIAKHTRNVTRGFSGIPFIGPYAHAISWVADAVRGVAAIFGWSKPLDPEFTTSVQYRFGEHLGHYNGDSKAKVLALDARNEIRIPSEIYGTEEDEMAIQSIVTKPTYMIRFKWTSADLPSSNLFAWPVDATSCLKDVFTNEPHNAVRMYNSNVSFVSQLFRYWRGTLCYRFKFVKTSFHTGRVKIMWVPGATLDTVIETIDINKVYSEVYDIRSTTEIDYCIPFTWNLPWKDSSDDSTSSSDTRFSWAVPTGMLYVEVVNSLRNPTTVADSVDVIVETYAGDDFQVAYPELYLQNSDGNTYGAWRRANLPVLTGVAQSAYPSPENREFSMNTLGIGEAVTSFRQVLRRYELPVATVTRDDVTPWRLTKEKNYAIRPYISSWTRVPPVNDLIGNKFDYFSMVMSLYRFMSGSMRLALLQYEGTGTAASYLVYGEHASVIEQAACVDMGAAGNVYRNVPIAPVVEPYETLAEFQLPYYSPIPVSLTDVGRPYLSTLTPLRVSNNNGPTMRITPTATSTLMRSIGEDFSFGYRIGVPVTYRNYP